MSPFRRKRTPDQLRSLAESSDPEDQFRSISADTPVEVLVALAHAREPRVRQRVASCSATPDRTLELLIYDRNAAVKKAANFALAERHGVSPWTKNDGPRGIVTGSGTVLGR